MNPERDIADERIEAAFATQYLFPVLFVMIAVLMIAGWIVLKLPVDILLSWGWPWPWSLIELAIELAADAVGFLIVTGGLAMGVGCIAMVIVWKLFRVRPSSTVITPLAHTLSGPVPRPRSSAFLSWGVAVLISVLAIIGDISWAVALPVDLAGFGEPLTEVELSATEIELDFL